MAPSDRDKPRSGEAAKPAQDSDPKELSSRGRIVIRSSSHPPGADSPITDPPPVVLLEDDGGAGDPLRAKKDTPAERPRKRKKVQAEQLAREQEAASASTRPAPERSQAEADRRLWFVLLVLAAVVGAIYWLAR